MMNIFHHDDDVCIWKIEQLSGCLVVYSIHKGWLKEGETEIRPKIIITNDRTTCINNNFFSKSKIIYTLNSFQCLVKLINGNFTRMLRENPNDEIVIKTHRHRKPNTYKKHIVKADQGDTILTTKNRVFKKSLILDHKKTFL